MACEAPLPAASIVVRMTNTAFMDRHPGFPAWLAANTQRLERDNPPLRMRAAHGGVGAWRGGGTGGFGSPGGTHSTGSGWGSGGCGGGRGLGGGGQGSGSNSTDSPSNGVVNSGM